MANRGTSLNTIINNLQKPDKAALNSAFLFCEARYPKDPETGESPIFDRAIRIALVASRLNVDSATIVAILLMFIEMDGKVTFRHIQDLFGGEVALMVRNAREIYNLPYKIVQDEDQIALAQHMVLSEAQDSRVLTMCMTNLLQALQEKQFDKKELQEKAKKALNIFVPIAHKLQLGTLKKELEDAAFGVLYPKEHKRLKSYVDAKLAEAALTVQEVQSILQRDLEKHKIRVTVIQGRIKSLYRLWEKLKTHNGEVENIHDIIASRVIVPDIASCYKAMKIVQKHFKVSREPKDYIKQPKDNGYRSLHVFIQIDSKAEVELQIRSNKMHYEAEYGHSAHWLYATKNQMAQNVFEEKTLVDILLKSYRGDHRLTLFPESIFVQWGDQKILQLPKNATGLDFVKQYAQIENFRKSLLKVNGKKFNLSSALYNGAQIEIG